MKSYREFKRCREFENLGVRKNPWRKYNLIWTLINNLMSFSGCRTHINGTQVGTSQACLRNGTESMLQVHGLSWGRSVRWGAEKFSLESKAMLRTFLDYSDRGARTENIDNSWERDWHGHSNLKKFLLMATYDANENQRKFSEKFFEVFLRYSMA